MNAFSRIFTLLGSFIVFVSIFGIYIDPTFAWYELSLATYLGSNLLKLQFFNIGYTFTFHNQFLVDTTIIQNLFHNPAFIIPLLEHIPKLILTSNTLLALGSIANLRLLNRLGSTTLLIFLIVLNLCLNLDLREDYYPLRVSSGTLLALVGATLALLSHFFDYTESSK